MKVDLLFFFYYKVHAGESQRSLYICSFPTKKAYSKVTSANNLLAVIEPGHILLEGKMSSGESRVGANPTIAVGKTA